MKIINNCASTVKTMRPSNGLIVIRNHVSSAFAWAFVLAFFVPLQAQEAPFDKIERQKVSFTVTHSFKTIIGRCNSVLTEGLKIERDPAGHFSLKGPFTLMVAIADMKTGNGNRDSHMYEILNFPRYKNIQIVVDKAVSSGTDQYRLDGRITLNGIAKSFSSTARANQTSNSVEINGQLTLLLSDFKIERPSLLFITIEDRIPVEYYFKIGRGN